MPQYLITAADRNGKSVRRLLDASSAKEARSAARANGLTPLSVVAADADTIKKQEEGLKEQLVNPLGGIKKTELSSAIRQFASLIQSNVALVESLNVLVEQLENKKLQQMLSAVREFVRGGGNLADAFDRFPNVFDKVFVNMIRAGESSGQLDTVLMRVADFQEEQLKFRGKVMGAMMYPIILMVVSVLIIVGIFTFVVPQLVGVFEGMGKEMPTPTKIMIAMSDFLRELGIYFLMAMAFGLVMLERFTKTIAGRAKKDRFLLSIPHVKLLIRDIIIARMAKTLSTLLASGVNMITALEITRNVSNNFVFEEAMATVKQMVSDGHPLAYSLKTTKIFPPILLHMVGVGEKTGDLEKMLNQVGADFERQTDSRLSTITSILSPLMIVILAGFVMFIAMSILLPIMEMNKFS